MVFTINATNKSLNNMSEINKITTIISAKALPIEERDGVFEAKVEFSTANGPFVINIDQIDDIYRGLVKCWPIIKPLKDDLNIRRRESVLAKAKADRAAREAQLADERSKRKADREASLARREAEKVAKEKKEAEAALKAEKAKEKRKTPQPGKEILKSKSKSKAKK